MNCTFFLIIQKGNKNFFYLLIEYTSSKRLTYYPGALFLLALWFFYTIIRVGKNRMDMYFLLRNLDIYRQPWFFIWKYIYIIIIPPSFSASNFKTFLFLLFLSKPLLKSSFLILKWNLLLDFFILKWNFI